MEEISLVISGCAFLLSVIVAIKSHNDTRKTKSDRLVDMRQNVLSTILDSQFIFKSLFMNIVTLNVSQYYKEVQDVLETAKKTVEQDIEELSEIYNEVVKRKD